MEGSVNTSTKIRTGYLCWNMPEENLKLMLSKTVILSPKGLWIEADHLIPQKVTWATLSTH